MNDARRATGPRSRRLTRTASLLVALITTTGLATGTALAAPADQAASNAASTWVPNDPMKAVAQMQPSWNLGNTMDAIPDETSWGNPLTTKALFDYLKAQGFKSVRIPVSWYPHQSATAPYTIDATWMARVKQVVDYALADGLYVDLNVHHDSWDWIENISVPSDHDAVLARFDATWTQIAAEFKDESRKLLFESVNEPQFAAGTSDAQKTASMNELNTAFHAVVRGSGGNNGNRLLMLPTQGCTPSQPLMDDLNGEIASLHDKNIVATVHFYGYYPFSVNIAGGTTYDATNQKMTADTFALMHSEFVAKGIPVYLGEYGLLSEPNSGTVEQGELLKYYEDVNYQARLNGVTSALWDDGNYLDRTAMQWREPDIFSMIKSSWKARSGTASSDNVFVPKGGPFTAQTLTLNLNGTTFKGLWNGHQKLVEGRDYTVSGTQLTLTARALADLSGNQAYGVNSTIKAEFSTGVPWLIHVISSDKPVLSDATGTTASLSIPTQYNGDQLETIKSQYADGTAAGSASWTAYQAFNGAFSPDYANNALVFKPDFLNSLKDGAPVTLTVEFWSGATVTYTVTKSGTTVTGTAS
ncbi:cellulase family glycosylhydrolase [Kitasatospora viridis]|uniref:Aryl-phospho-beta-D-glucosidase BglC (GH1 family) n=1 Tax=Kitasatospora viridis TaxID=281105 RepID=A0A561TVD9_9ACTN|nr:cellulase family glycosylhydrolase [Kitasatospora viridis]TWF91072.1 aryl-phospho-beta-D-glucosidase BglC (GH1 family) [Kitasatospora viridis]